MKPFRYERAQDMARAVATLTGEPGGAFLAGGTNLVDLMKLGVVEPDVLVDVRELTSGKIEDLPGGGLRIGAAVTNSDLAADRRVRARYPVLSQASGCSALGGYTRYHAILGASESCVATHPSDMAVALAALDATVRVLGPDGARSIPLVEFHRLPGDAPERDTVLTHGELITAVDVPPLPFAERSRYYKVRDRASYAFALVSVAAALDLAGGTVRDARIAFGGVAHKPWRAPRAEAALRGAHATEETFRRAADSELAGAQPLDGNGFKISLVRNTLTMVLRDLAQRETR
jgi:xanthine dehydrogenase YagS FAD-binding subunit